MNVEPGVQIEIIDRTIEEALRFIWAAKVWKRRLQKDRYGVFSSKEAAAAKRASLDLTRVLADFRR